MNRQPTLLEFKSICRKEINTLVIYKELKTVSSLKRQFKVPSKLVFKGLEVMELKIAS